MTMVYKNSLYDFPMHIQFYLVYTQLCPLIKILNVSYSYEGQSSFLKYLHYLAVLPPLTGQPTTMINYYNW